MKKPVPCAICNTTFDHVKNSRYRRAPKFCTPCFKLYKLPKPQLAQLASQVEAAQFPLTQLTTTQLHKFVQHPKRARFPITKGVILNIRKFIHHSNRATGNALLDSAYNHMHLTECPRCHKLTKPPNQKFCTPCSPPFAKNLHAIRTRKGLTQSQLATIANIDQHAISKYENNQRFPTLLNISKLATALSVTPEQLLKS